MMTHPNPLWTSWTPLLVAAGLLAGCSGGGSDPIDTPDAGSDDIDVPFTQGTSTLAGGAAAGYLDGSRKVARFADPVNVAYRDGRLYVADFDNGRIRVIDTTTYETSTLIAQAGFQRPFGLSFAANGTLYISTDNDKNGGHSLMTGSIWRVAPGAHTATLVIGGIGRPRGLAALPDGRLAIADYAHHVVRLLDPGTAEVMPLAGAWDQAGCVDASGGAARFAAPYGLALAGDGTLVVADFDNHQIRRVTLDGVVTTLAGTGIPGFHDGAPGEAMFRRPQGVTIAANGEIYVTDTDNFRIRRITATAVDTVVGNGKPGYLDANDPLSSELYGLEGLAITSDGAMLYIADGTRGEDTPYNRIRQVVRRW
jgi:DNA-binding beta-propeller fold protein YncE